MSNYIARRKRRQRWQAERKHLIQTIRSNNDLRYELGRLRSDGWLNARPRWQEPLDHIAIPRTDEGVVSLRLKQIADTVAIDPDLMHKAARDPKWMMRHLEVKAVESITDHLLKAGAIQRYTQHQHGHSPVHRFMWSCWVGVRA